MRGYYTEDASAVLNEAAAIRTFLLNSWRSSFWLWMDYYLLCLGG